jgi:hypothetical protein
MYWDAKLVKPLPGYRIYVELENGRKGIFDLNPYLDRGVFRELRDVHYFNQVDIFLGAVTWPNEQDIAPETLLDEMVNLDSGSLPGSTPLQVDSLPQSGIQDA